VTRVGEMAAQTIRSRLAPLTLFVLMQRLPYGIVNGTGAGESRPTT